MAGLPGIRCPTFAPLRVSPTSPKQVAKRIAPMVRQTRNRTRRYRPLFEASNFDHAPTQGSGKRQPRGRWRAKEKAPNESGLFLVAFWRRRPESNRRTRLCRPLHNHFATPPGAQHRIVAIHDEPRICRADKEKGKQGFPSGLERETRLELATSTLARLRSTN